ncbi:hypothetical protein QFC21_000833 [Naganishia friedmannii]|uniref:Uncharacterized protein n=1 Tax=Naganishia friedmannii TaxID=89922 RepID=A0ACC2W7D1_9TREE|nr:hypothetical protein QFC21_000833 [Naganishia friedmannii]
MPITASQLRSFLKDVKEEKAKNNAPPPPEAPGALHFGPLEQAIMVLIIVGMVSDPATTGIPSTFSDLPRENPPKPASRSSASASSAAREKEKEKEKIKASGTQVTTKEDLLKDQSRLKNKAASTSKDVRAATKKTQYFLTMNGKRNTRERSTSAVSKRFEDCTYTTGRTGAPEGTLWWNNVSNLKITPHYFAVDDMMVPPGAPAKSSREERKEKEASKHAQPPGTISAEEIAARLPLEREMERYERVMMIMQCILALLLCFIDQRLGLVLLAFFLFSYFRAEKEKERFRARNVAALPSGSRNPYEEKFDYGGTGVD